MTKQERATYMRTWRSKNKEKVALSRKADYEKNSEAYKERAKKYAGSETRKKWKENNKEKISQYHREKWLKDKGKRQYLSRYGLTLEEYRRMFEEQEGRCPGCTRHESELDHPLHVDHCHTGGQVRGLLCRDCNALLGFAKDNPSILRNLINYLEGEQSTPAS